MKMSIFGMLFILTALTVGPLIYFNGGADFLSDMTKSKSGRPEINRDIVYAPVTTDEKVTVYKWKDENGVWQFGSIVPPGVKAEPMTLQPNVNVMKPVDVPEVIEDRRGTGLVSIGKEREFISSKKNENKDEKEEFGISEESLENPYAPESISELLNTTKGLQGVFNNRQSSQNVGK